jgi:hypothetical protein
MMQRMREWQQRQGGQPGAPGQHQPGAGATQGQRPQAAAPGQRSGAAPQGNQAAGTPQGRTGRAAPQNAQTIDALFGPLPETQSFGRVWRYVDGKLTGVRVRLGVTDGTNTELVTGDLPENTPVVTGVQINATPSPTTGGQRSPSNSPLMPQRGGRGPGGH